MSDQSVILLRKTMVRQLDPQKRAQFLQAAQKLFVANGVQNTSTAAIAKAAGTASGTLFLYFPTKNNLINELVLEIGRAQAAAINAAVQPEFSAQESFSAIWNSSVRWFLAHLEAYQYIQQVRDSGLIEPAVVEESAQLFAFYYIAMQKGLTEGSIKPYPLELIGEILYRQIIAVTNLCGRTTGAAEQENLIQAGFTIFWDGIKA
jgi:AcrR family transcriptional regulator